MADLTIYGTGGLPLMCDTGGCGSPANFVWYGGWDGKPRRCCPAHNPMSLPGALPTGFHGSSLCYACGQPVNVGAMIAHG